MEGTAPIAILAVGAFFDYSIIERKCGMVGGRSL